LDVDKSAEKIKASALGQLRTEEQEKGTEGVQVAVKTHIHTKT
jgi:hypothetical protein